MHNLFGGMYKNRRVLVTGHTGFKGSWLAFWLAKMGASVTGYSLKPSTDPSHFGVLDMEIDSVIGDICDAPKLQKVFENAKPEIVFHLAAQPLVRLSYENPLETYRSNVLGTLSVCEAVRHCDSVKAMVAITTDKVYENREWDWSYRENDPLGGYDPYSSSKACAEILLSSYRNSYFNIAEYGKSHNVLLCSVRAGNVIGGGDWSKDRLIPDIMKAASENKPVVIRNPHATRPWQHVLECLSGYLCVGEHLLQGSTQHASSYNFGPAHDDALAVEKIADLATGIWPSIKCEFPKDLKEPHEAGKLHLDCMKAYAGLRWRPIWNIESALRSTVSWYRAWYEKQQVMTGDDLELYINDASKKGAVWA